MNLIRSIARSLIPFRVRDQARNIFFDYARKSKAFDFLRNFGVLICKNYVQVNCSNVEVLFSDVRQRIKTHTVLETNEVDKTIATAGQEIPPLKPFSMVTEALVLKISSRDFSFRNSHFLDQDLNVLGCNRDVCFDEDRPLPIYRQFLPTPIHLGGTVAYLSDADPENYYHWMCEVLPFLSFYQRVTDLSEIDYFYTGQLTLSNFHVESLQKAGIPVEKLVKDACTADRLLMIIINRSTNLTDPLVRFSHPIDRDSYLFLRNLFKDDFKLNLVRRKRFYIKRGDVNRRKILNEAEVITLLERYGFEAVTMDKKTIQEQVEMFSSAEAIVALHGAALTNLLFVQPNTKVIELLPYKYVNNCFYALASHADADYFYLESEPLEESNIDSRYTNAYISIDKLKKTLEMTSLI